MSAQANPFSLRAVLVLVAFGAAVFVALLWMLGAGVGLGSINDGGSHVGGRGLNGYAGIAELLERQGWQVRRSRSRAAFDQPGLLVLTPPAYIKPDEIDEAITKHRYKGPTLLVLPKWVAVDLSRTGAAGVRKGWVKLIEADPPAWADKLKTLGQLDVRVDQAPRNAGAWQGPGGLRVRPTTNQVQSLSSGDMETLVRDARDQPLAAFLDDNGYYPDLADAAGEHYRRDEPGAHADDKDDNNIYPVIVVAEPDLIDNYALADRDRAMLALELFGLAAGGRKMPVAFDLTLPGYARSANLLTLAFTPPFLAATLCLILAAIAAGWRAFVRFGPPRVGTRAIAFGKRALVGNSAGLIRRARRLHLLGPPYADAARERLALALGLPPRLPAGAGEAALDRALALRAPDQPPFSVTAARMRSARRPLDLLRAAQALHSLERMIRK